MKTYSISEKRYTIYPQKVGGKWYFLTMLYYIHVYDQFGVYYESKWVTKKSLLTKSL
jgi:hypothetical protein